VIEAATCKDFIMSAKAQSDDEKHAVLQRRIQFGYPLHAPPHPFREHNIFLITAATYKHQRILNTKQRRTVFQEDLHDSLRQIECELIAWVILPDHYHFLAEMSDLNDLAVLLQLLPGRNARKWNQEDLLTGQRKVWYRYTDHVMRNEVHLEKSFNYIHYNPVKHGYVNDPYAWQWSSLQVYLEQEGREWLQNCWRRAAPTCEFGKGWDD
jgi:putative transposase